MSRLDFVNDNIKKGSKLSIKAKDFSKKLDFGVLGFTKTYVEYILKQLNHARQPQIFSIKRIEKDLNISKNSRVSHIGRYIYQELTIGTRILIPVGSVGRTVQYIVKEPVRTQLIKYPEMLHNIANDVVYRKIKAKGLELNSKTAVKVVVDEYVEQSREDLDLQFGQYLNTYLPNNWQGGGGNRQSMESLISWISDMAKEPEDDDSK